MRALLVSLLLIASTLLAQTQMNVEQLVEFIKSELALHQHSDKQIAAGVRQIQLTEKLTDKTIIDLQAQGIGQKTTEALKIQRDLTANIKPPSHNTVPAKAAADQGASVESPTVSLTTKAPPIPPPSSIRQEEIRQAITDYALNYTKNLPNFFCVEVTRQFVDPNGGTSYRSLGSILARVSYHEGQDHYSVYSVNSKLVDETSMDSVKTGGATSTGEFYSLMKSIFDPQSQTEFGWDHWATLRGRRMAVFNYSIDSAHSSYYIHYGESKDDDQRIVTAYRGLVYADPDTGEIDRIKFEAMDIPQSFPVKESSEILDYDLVDISGNKYVVPLAAKLYMKAGRESTKNEIEFKLYRKFEAGSTIKYDLDPNAPPPPPLPDSATEEKPPTTAPNKRENPWVLPTPPPPPPQ